MRGMTKKTADSAAFNPLRVLWFAFALVGVPVLTATVLTSGLACGDPELCNDAGMGGPVFLVLGFLIGVGLIVVGEVFAAIRKRSRNNTSR